VGGDIASEKHYCEKWEAGQWFMVEEDEDKA
jgi:hypothetical protein